MADERRTKSESASEQLKVSSGKGHQLDNRRQSEKGAGVSREKLSEGKEHPHIPFIEDRHRSAAWRKGDFNRKVVCAVDPSAHSRFAFDWYLKNVWKPDDLVIVVYCPEFPNLPSFSIKNGLSLPTERWKEIMNETNSRINKLEEHYEVACIEKKVKYMIRGESSKHPGEGVIRIVEAEKAQLIVLGCRGMGSVKRFFLGSVSEYVTRHAKVPCVIVPNEMH